MAINVIEMTDIEFLTAVLEELDRGWITGQMCDRAGRKCLVGAGSAVLGFDFNELQAKRVAWESHLIPYWEFHDYQIFADQYHEVAGERLFKLLELEIVDESDGLTYTVTLFNDDFEYFDELRPQLVDAIAKLGADHVD